jgi:hypothetical protein
MGEQKGEGEGRTFEIEFLDPGVQGFFAHICLRCSVRESSKGAAHALRFLLEPMWEYTLH